MRDRKSLRPEPITEHAQPAYLRHDSSDVASDWIVPVKQQRGWAMTCWRDERAVVDVIDLWLRPNSRGPQTTSVRPGVSLRDVHLREKSNLSKSDTVSSFIPTLAYLIFYIDTFSSLFGPKILNVDNACVILELCQCSKFCSSTQQTEQVHEYQTCSNNVIVSNSNGEYV